jgi:hypothetical protein
MKSRLVSGCVAAVCAITLLACSSARVDSTAPAAPPQMRSFQLLPELPPPSLQGFKPCKLGESCMALDDRPFEPCLVTTRRCADMIEEPLLVGEPKDIPQPPESNITISR